eukprot:g11617.t1
MGGVSSTGMLTVALAFGARISGTSKPSVDVDVKEESNPLVDWGEWPDYALESDSTNTWPEFIAGREALGRSEESTGYAGSLYDLVDECSRRLELRNVSCGGDEPQEEYRIPFMEAGDLPCGFQTRMTNETLEDLASRFEFHFVGDSTTRRLAESFVSIVTGEGSNHILYHEDRNLSSGILQAWFHWAPYCVMTEQHPSVTTPFKDIISKQEEEKENKGDKRTIFVTAFGIWDIVHRGGDTAACAEVIQWLVEEAPFSSAGAYLAEDDDEVSPPVLFLLQNNPFLPGSEEDSVLEELHQVQREVVENHGEGSQAELYLVHDRESLYDSMMCYRIEEEIHFQEPVKLIEGKMLWDLVALVVGVGGGGS